MGARHPTQGLMDTQMQSVKGSHSRVACSFKGLSPASRWTSTGQVLLDGPQKQQIAQDVPTSTVDRALQRKYQDPVKNLRNGCLDGLSKSQEGAHGSSKCDTVSFKTSVKDVLPVGTTPFKPS